MQWQAVVHAGGKALVPLFVNEVRIQRNYITKYCDVISLEVSMLEGDYYHDVVPFKSTLEVTLTMVPMSAGDTPTIDTGVAQKQFRYKATLFDGRDPTLEGNNPMASDKEKANRASFTSVRFQLINPIIEFIRTKTVGGVYRNCTGASLIRSLLTAYSKDGTADTSIRLKGVTVAPRFNNVPREHIEIPHLTPMVEMPRVVERVSGGIYSTGFEFYLQGQFWYLYSPYNLKAYEDSPRSLTILNVPKDRFPTPEASYRTTPTQVVLMATGETKHNDFSEEMQLNVGNGVRFVDAAKVMESFGATDDNKLTVTRSKLINEFTIDERETGLNVVKQSAAKITANYLTEYSNLAIRSGSFVQLAWENGDPDILYPGMAVRMLYLKNNEPMEVFGVLVGTDTFSMPNANHIGPRRFTSQVAITIFIARKTS